MNACREMRFVASDSLSLDDIDIEKWPECLFKANGPSTRGFQESATMLSLPQVRSKLELRAVLQLRRRSLITDSMPQ